MPEPAILFKRVEALAGMIEIVVIEIAMKLNETVRQPSPGREH